MEIQRIKFEINSENPESGIHNISLVTEPASESNFQFLSKESEKPKYVELKQYEQVVHGIALKPDMDIIRFDSQKNPYYIYFTKESVKNYRNDFHKKQNTKNVNLQHKDNEFIDAYLIESFIIDSPERLADVKAKGIEDATDGSWYTAYKIEDKQAFSRVLSGELKGFSPEIYLAKMTALPTENNFSKIESYMNKFLEKFKSLVSEMEKDETKSPEKLAGAVPPAPAAKAAPAPAKAPADAKTPAPAPAKQSKSIPDDTLLGYSDVGQPVVVIADDGSSSPCPAGVYNMDDGSQLTVGEDGNLISVGDAQLAKAKKEDFKAENETLKTQVQNLKSEVEKLKKTPSAEPIQKNDTKEDLAKRIPAKPLNQMTASERMKFKYNFN